MSVRSERATAVTSPQDGPPFWSVRLTEDGWRIVANSGDGLCWIEVPDTGQDAHEVVRAWRAGEDDDADE